MAAMRPSHGRTLTLTPDVFPSDVQRAICRRLNDTPYFHTAPGIMALPRCQGDFITAMQAAIGKAGIVVLVLPGEGKFVRTDTPVPGIAGTWRIRVEENPAVNRTAGGTRQPAEDVAWAAVQRLHLWVPQGPNREALAGGALIPGQIEHSETGDKDGTIYFSSEFTVLLTGGDAAGSFGRALVRAKAP